MDGGQMNKTPAEDFAKKANKKKRNPSQITSKNFSFNSQTPLNPDDL